MATKLPTCPEFCASARRHFGFLVSEFGYSEIALPCADNTNEFQVRFQSVSVFVMIEGINLGFGVQVVLSPLEDCISRRQAMLPLWTILKLRCPDLYQACARADGQLAQLEAYAIALNTCAGDVLRGDFSILPAAAQVMLDEASKERALEKQRQYERGSAQASNAFHRKDYVEFIRLIDPYAADKLTSSQRMQLEYAKRQSAR